MIHPRLCNAKPNFYPRSPCGERQNGFAGVLFLIDISIHALLAESDHFDTLSALAPKQFLSTLSLRRATIGLMLVVFLVMHFYPRSPCGERPVLGIQHRAGELFLSTLSLRRATCVFFFFDVSLNYFYPRSPCGERRRNRFCPTCQWHFYPRSPCGERPRILI